MPHLATSTFGSRACTGLPRAWPGARHQWPHPAASCALCIQGAQGCRATKLLNHKLPSRLAFASPLNAVMSARDEILEPPPGARLHLICRPSIPEDLFPQDVANPSFLMYSGAWCRPCLPRRRTPPEFPSAVLLLPSHSSVAAVGPDRRRRANHQRVLKAPRAMRAKSASPVHIFLPASPAGVCLLLPAGTHRAAIGGMAAGAAWPLMRLCGPCGRLHQRLGAPLQQWKCTSMRASIRHGKQERVGPAVRVALTCNAIRCRMNPQSQPQCYISHPTKPMRHPAQAKTAMRKPRLQCE